MTIRNLLRTIPVPLILMLAAKAQTSPAADFKGAFLHDLSDIEKKFTSLAEAMPDAKYSWRPEKGVRSVSEVFAHVAAANHFFLNFVGVKPPAGIMTLEKTATTKAAVVDALKSSFDAVRKAVGDLTDADLAKQTKFFGGQMVSYQTVLFSMANHMHEHLGQSIAYARDNQITPPWSKGGTD